MSTRRRVSTLLRQAAVLGSVTFLVGCVATSPLREDGFASCQDARAAVETAGPAGVQFAHERIYSDPLCFFDDSNYSQFPAARQIGDERCIVGYVCIEKTSGVGGG